jgi:hypothetical protein
VKNKKKKNIAARLGAFKNIHNPGATKSIDVGELYQFIATNQIWLAFEKCSGECDYYTLLDDVKDGVHLETVGDQIICVTSEECERFQQFIKV